MGNRSGFCSKITVMCSFINVFYFLIHNCLHGICATELLFHIKWHSGVLPTSIAIDIKQFTVVFASSKTLRRGFWYFNY